MKKILWVLAGALFIASLIQLNNLHLEFLLLLSSSTGLIALIELEANWEQKIPLRYLVSHLSKVKLKKFLNWNAIGKCIDNIAGGIFFSKI